MIITFCGHSQFPKSSENEYRIMEVLNEIVAEEKAELYLGGYGGFDDLAYSCCKKYKESHPNVSLIFITPYLTPEYQRNYLKSREVKYDEIIYPEIENKPLKFAISYRNMWMVDKADYVVCGITHACGGAYKTYKYAKRKNKTVINITGMVIQ